MIIFDGTQAVTACVAKATSDFGVSDVTISDVRHYFYRLVVNVMKQFALEYSKEAVFAFDSSVGYWRKDEFKFYKFRRSNSSKEYPFDPEFRALCINTLAQEIDKFSPYKMIRVDKAEADDVIGVIVKHHVSPLGDIVDKSNMKNFMIISSDEDFIQLQQYPGVDQYSSIKAKFIRDENPHKALFEKICRGDSGDDVPSALSVDDQFVNPQGRQKQIRSTKVDEWYEQYNQGVISEELVYFNRNKKLIDLSEVPAIIQGRIIEMYETAPVNTRSGFLQYFVDKKLKGFDEEMTFF